MKSKMDKICHVDLGIIRISEKKEENTFIFNFSGLIKAPTNTTNEVNIRFDDA